MQCNSKLRNSNLVLLVTAVILAAVAFFRVHVFQDPSGGDGYFYLKQTEWLAQHFQFYHADYSFVFIPLAVLYKLTGSSLLAYQLLSCSSYLIILFCSGTFVRQGLSWLGTASSLLLSVLLTIGLSFQMPLQRLCFEFIKSGFAIALFFLAGWFLLKKRAYAALAVGLLAALTHKTVALMVIAGIALFILQLGRYRRSYLLIPVGLLAAAISFIPRLSRHLFNFLTEFRLESPANLFQANSHLVWSHVILILLWLTAFFTALIQRRLFHEKDTPLRSFYGVLLIFAVIPLLPMFGGPNYEIKWRLMIFSFVFSYIVFFYALSFWRKKILIYSALAVCFLFMAFEAGNESDFPWVNRWSEHAPNVQELTQFVQPGEELITHHGMQFYIDYRTPIRAKSLLTPNERPKYQLAYIPEFYLLNPDAKDSVEQVKLLSVGELYGLFYYDDFQDLLRAFPVMRDNKNVFRLRPDFVESYPSK